MPTFPDFPGHRFMYDQDGTLVQYSPVNAALPLTVLDPALLNDEDTDGISHTGGSSAGYREFTFVFPEVRDVTGIFAMSSVAVTLSMWYSVNTTDGSDGTWVAYTGAMSGSLSLVPNARANIVAVAGVTGVKGIRLRFATPNNANTAVQTVHIYGDTSTTASPERLEFWDSVQDQKLDKMGLDFGDVAAGTTAVKQFRLKNLSATRTATGIDVVRDNNAGGAINDSFAAALQFSLDGGTTWANGVTIGSIPPGGYSVAIRVRRVVPASEVSGSRFARVRAIPTTFAA